MLMTARGVVYEINGIISSLVNILLQLLTC